MMEATPESLASMDLQKLQRPAQDFASTQKVLAEDGASEGLHNLIVGGNHLAARVPSS